MNSIKSMEELFNKFVNNQLSKKEYEAFITLVKDAESQEQLRHLLAKLHQSGQVLKSYTPDRNSADVDQLYTRLIHKIENKRILPKLETRNFVLKKASFRNFYKSVVVLLLLGGMFYFIQTDFLNLRESTTSIQTDNEEQITLKLANGELLIISGSGKGSILGSKGSFVAAQNGSRLNYTKQDNFKEVAFNELTIPKGRQFDLVLTDGTQVTLNAGSWIKYPVQFNTEGNREVFLKGEAYFDVAKDEAHPFVVNTGVIDIEVLGTRFNVSNYPEDSYINTVLVEGSVKVYEENSKDDKTASTVLTPGHLAAWDNSKMEMTNEKVDVSLYTAWKFGILKFKNTSFHNIRKQLERHFNVQIENHDEFLETQVYTATFREESIEEILNAFNEDVPFEYEITDDKVIITKQQLTSKSEKPMK